MNISREVIIDLWPAYSAGEASADTRSLVEEFLQQDPEFAQLLEEKVDDEDLLKAAAPTLPPDREAQALNQTKRHLHGWDWSLLLLIISMSFTFQAFGRIIADTSWDVSPRNFIVMSMIATGCWCAYIIRRLWVRRKFYRKPPRPGE